MLNFHFASSPPKQQMAPRVKRNTMAKSKHDMQRYNRSQEDRSSARRKASLNMFHLHSSPDHAFILSRIAKQGYTFSGPDISISWDAVRAVRFLAPASANQADTPHEICPICLDIFTSARITKCGHSFCYPCLLQHIHSSGSIDATAVVKCPCCSLPIYVDDIRPVLFDTVQSPKTQTRMKFVKLHRCKRSPTPYLPQRGQWKRSAPYSAPSMTDDDNIFSRFNYIDPVAYIEFLKTNQAELENYSEDMKNIVPSSLEIFFATMSIERVQRDILAAFAEMDDEQLLVERFKQEQAGIYQKIPDSLFFNRFSPDITGTDEVSTQMPRKESLVADCGQNFCRLSTGIDNDKRPRGESIGSESSGNLSHISESRLHKAKRKPKNLPASLYLEQDEYQFYQAIDGQMCFLSKFNMNCLTHEFSTHAPLPSPSIMLDSSHGCNLIPLPDVVEGTVIEIESLHLTPEMRKRMPFLSHLPLYTDIVFVELDLNALLSAKTVGHFRAESEKRKSRRKKILHAEKKIDRENKKKEEQRIDNLKARFHDIDPNDTFFQTAIIEPDQPMTGESFGPSITGEERPNIASRRPTIDPPVSFRAVVNTPSSVTITEDSFPALGSSNRNNPVSCGITVLKQQPRSWHQECYAKHVTKKAIENDFLTTSGRASSSEGGKKSKNKKKQIVLFSTGSGRGGGY